MLKSATMGRVDIKVNSPGTPLLVMGNPTQLQQVIMNIANNGIQAIEETGAPGLLEIWLDWAQDLGPAKGRGQVGGQCHMVFKDNGAGMNSEQIQRAFDPFFTTKPVGKGTGLGLSVVYGIVKDHGGEIAISSQIGLGTEVTVNLPAIGKRALRVVGA
jgi:signal transduction histidine kinase